MIDLIKPISKTSKLEFWEIISKESYLFFESLYIQKLNEYNDYSVDNDERIRLYCETNNLRILLLIHFCMICESIVNNYGTLKLGEKFYSTKIEKVNPISRKISLLKSIISNKEIEEKHILLIKLQKYYDYRNDFVHPKYKASLKDNPWEPKIIDLTKVFDKNDSEELKRTISELIIFLFEEEATSCFYKERYNWTIK